MVPPFGGTRCARHKRSLGFIFLHGLKSKKSTRKNAIPTSLSDSLILPMDSWKEFEKRGFQVLGHCQTHSNPSRDSGRGHDSIFTTWTNLLRRPRPLAT